MESGEGGIIRRLGVAQMLLTLLMLLMLLVLLNCTVERGVPGELTSSSSTTIAPPLTSFTLALVPVAAVAVVVVEASVMRPVAVELIDPLDILAFNS